MFVIYTSDLPVVIRRKKKKNRMIVRENLNMEKNSEYIYQNYPFSTQKFLRHNKPKKILILSGGHLDFITIKRKKKSEEFTIQL